MRRYLGKNVVTCFLQVAFLISWYGISNKLDYLLSIVALEATVIFLRQGLTMAMEPLLMLV